MGSKDPYRGIMAVPHRDFEKRPFGQRLKGLRLSSEYGYKLTYDIQVQDVSRYDFRLSCVWSTNLLPLRESCCCKSHSDPSFGLCRPSSWR